MKQIISASIAGLIFGLGLTISQMLNPAKVLSFLDIFGDWDPSLALVMGSALVVAAIGFRIVFTRQAPLFAAAFSLPRKTDLDPQLVGGAALFGIGWGMSGLCPGPALTALSFGTVEVLSFFASMIAGIVIFRLMAPLISSAPPVPQNS